MFLTLAIRPLTSLRLGTYALRLLLAFGRRGFALARVPRPGQLPFGTGPFRLVVRAGLLPGEAFPPVSGRARRGSSANVERLAFLVEVRAEVAEELRDRPAQRLLVL